MQKGRTAGLGAGERPAPGQRHRSPCAAANSFAFSLGSPGSGRTKPLTQEGCLLWFAETILKQLLEDDWAENYRSGFRPGEGHTVWCWHQMPVWDLPARAEQAAVTAPSSKRVASCGGLLTAQVALSQYPPPLPGSLSKWHHSLKQWIILQIHTKHCQTSPASFSLPPPGTMQPHLTWETMAIGSFNTITAVFQPFARSFSLVYCPSVCAEAACAADSSGIWWHNRRGTDVGLRLFNSGSTQRLNCSQDMRLEDVGSLISSAPTVQIPVCIPHRLWH